MPALQPSYKSAEWNVGSRPRISNVGSDRVGKEMNHVNRQLRSVSRLAATALLVGVAVLACGRPNGAADNGPAASMPAAQQTTADQAAVTLATTPSDAAADSPTPSDAATDPTGATSAPAVTAAAGTTDQLDSQLSNLDNLLNGVNGSLSGSDASGGE
jgi:hypothetical protein